MDLAVFLESITAFVNLLCVSIMMLTMSPFLLFLQACLSSVTGQTQMREDLVATT